MEALMLVEVLDVHGQVQVQHRVRRIGGRCRLGRALGCDVVLHDPFVAAEHVLLTLQADGRVHVEDLQTVNGTFAGTRRIGAAGARFDGVVLLVGRTRVRVRTAVENLAAERPLRRDHLRRHRTLLALGGVLLCLLFAGVLQWVAGPDGFPQRLVIAELVALAALALWVGAWTLVSRLTVGAWQVRIHLAIAAACLALWAWGGALHALGAFALQWRWLGSVMLALAGGVALGAAYLHLRNATHFGRLVALMLALPVPVLVGGVWWLVEAQWHPQGVNAVQTGPAVWPPAWRIAPSVELADFLADAEQLQREASRHRQSALRESPAAPGEE